MTTPSERIADPRHETLFETPTEYELVITRTFEAPRALVWAAFTDPRHLPHWNTGPEGCTMPVCEIDLRPGGTWHYQWRHAQGAEFSATGIYEEVDPPARLVQVSGADGHENIIVTTFAEERGRTTVTVVQRYANVASRDQALRYARGGLASSYARLKRYLSRVDALKSPLHITNEDI